jgi:RNA-directed DNA polymerase
MKTKLPGIVKKARDCPKTKFTSLAHVLSPEFLRESWNKLNKRGTYGVDEVTTEQYRENLEPNLRRLWERLRNGAYRAVPVRRVEIPKSNGSTRPLGIPTVEDRVLQASVARILNAIYEPLFQEESYGFRPGRSAHGALRQLRRHIIAGKVMHVCEVDIRSYFDRVNHDWLRRMLRERVSDPVILRLVDKWLRAGVLKNGLFAKTEDGVPQGGPISPILANIYLHYVLDLWFNKVFKRECRGEAYLVRYADDFVVCFQRQEDARVFMATMRERLGKFHLEIAEEKTRQIVFGRFAAERMAEKDQKPSEFNFLGFRHICGIDRAGKFALVRLPVQRSITRFLEDTKKWLWEHMHWKVRDQRQKLSEKLRGFYGYYALPHCGRKLYAVYSEVLKQWRGVLKRRSQRSQTHWSYLRNQNWFTLPTPLSLHFDV